MKKTIKQIGNWMWGHKKTMMLIGLVVLVLTDANSVHAAEIVTDDSAKVEQELAQLVNVLVRFFNTLLWPLLLLIGDLLDVDMITGPGMEERLLAIWVEMRNMVNIAIALLLVVVAFYNVLGLGGGEGELAIKTALPKIVLGLVLVNFTYVGGKVVLDAANVGTTIAFALPQIMNDSEINQFNLDGQLEDFERTVCYPSVTVDKQDNEDPADDIVSKSFWTKEAAPLQTKLFCELATVDSDVEGEPDIDQYGGIKESLKGLYFEDLNKNNMAIVMAVNMGALGSLELLKPEAIKTFTDLTVNTIFSLVMYLILTVSYLVLAIVLIVRLIVLWLALALSPLAVLIYAIPQIKEWLGGGGDFSQKVIKHLIAPIIIGLTLSMGFLLLEGWSVMSQSDASISEVVSGELLVTGIDDLPKLILAIASIVVIWKGVFAAASDTYASGITDRIKDFGGTVKDALTNFPLVQPFLPIEVEGEKGEGLSIRGAQSLITGKLGDYASGEPLQKEIEGFDTSNNPFIKWARSNRGDRTPERIQGLLNGLDSKQIDHAKALELARYLEAGIQGNRKIERGDQTALLKTLAAETKNGNINNPEFFKNFVEDFTKATNKKGEQYEEKDLNLISGNLDQIKDLTVLPKEKEKEEEESGASAATQQTAAPSAAAASTQSASTTTVPSGTASTSAASSPSTATPGTANASTTTVPSGAASTSAAGSPSTATPGTTSTPSSASTPVATSGTTASQALVTPTTPPPKPE